MLIHLRDKTLVLEVTLGADTGAHWDGRTGAEGINRRAGRIAATVSARSATALAR